VFLIKPLPFEFMPEYYNVVKIMSRIYGESKKDTTKTEEEFGMALLNNLSEEDMKIIQLIVKKSLELSYPDDDKGELEGFATAHLFEILNTVLEANTFAPNTKTKS
jgi:hypothetical protein